MRKLFLGSCLCDETCSMPTQDKAVESPPRGHLPPSCPKQPSAVWARVCTQAHHCVCAQFFAPPPLFVRQLHIPCTNPHCAVVDFPRQDTDSAQAGDRSCLQHSYNNQLRLLSRPGNRFEGPDISPCHPPFCSVTKRNLDSRSAHRFLRNSRVLMPDNSGALWLSPSPSARQFIHMSLQSKLQSFRINFIVLFHFCSLVKLKSEM